MLSNPPHTPTSAKAILSQTEVATATATCSNHPTVLCTS